jgi:aminopeptidase N
MPCACSRDEHAEQFRTDIDTQLALDVGESAPNDSGFASKTAVVHYEPATPLKPVHLVLDLDFDIPTKTLVATVSTTVIATVDGARTLRLNAERFDSVTAVRFSDAAAAAGATLPSVFTYDGHVIDAVLAAPGLAVGATACCVVEYTVVDPVTGLFFSQTGDGTNYVVSDHETERARYWLPCIDHPSVRTTLLFNITAAAGLTVLANGALVSETPSQGARRVTSWKMDQITPSYLLCVAVGDFLKCPGGLHAGKEVAFFAPNGGHYRYTPANLVDTFGLTADMMAWLEKRVGVPIPWPKYFTFAVGEIGGAMENSSLVSFDESAIVDDRDSGERQWGVMCTTLHELVHTFFGNAVVCRDFGFSFMKESFAKFMEVTCPKFHRTRSILSTPRCRGTDLLTPTRSTHSFSSPYFGGVALFTRCASGRIP